MGLVGVGKGRGHRCRARRGDPEVLVHPRLVVARQVAHDRHVARLQVHVEDRGLPGFQRGARVEHVRAHRVLVHPVRLTVPGADRERSGERLGREPDQLVVHGPGVRHDEAHRSGRDVVLGERDRHMGLVGVGKGDDDRRVVRRIPVHLDGGGLAAPGVVGDHRDGPAAAGDGAARACGQDQEQPRRQGGRGMDAGSTDHGCAPSALTGFASWGCSGPSVPMHGGRPRVRRSVGR